MTEETSGRDWLAGLPFGLTLTSLTPTDDGLQAGVQGDDIPIRR